jgi:hypothetical protein
MYQDFRQPTRIGLPLALRDGSPKRRDAGFVEVGCTGLPDTFRGKAQQRPMGRSCGNIVAHVPAAFRSLAMQRTRHRACPEMRAGSFRDAAGGAAVLASMGFLEYGIPWMSAGIART